MADLFHSIPINASPKDVYDAVATQKGMRGWWTRDTKMDERVGGNAASCAARNELGKDIHAH